MQEKSIISVFTKAFIENPLLAMKILFWSRDIRGGAGERKFFQTVVKYLEEEAEPVLQANLGLVPEFGYWKDYWASGLEFDTYKSFIKEGLENADGLLAKWLPRKGPLAKYIREYLGITPKAYRKMVVALSKTVEQKMSAKEFDTIKYEHVPSKAFNKYRKAFERNDEKRFKEFISQVEKGEKKINASAVFPYDLYRSYLRGDDKASINAQWSQLPNYLEDSDERMLPMVDTSGSMRGFRSSPGSDLSPADIANSLGVYLSERNTGPFKDAYLSFNSTARLNVLTGKATNRFDQLRHDHFWGGSTNLISAFELILKVAKRDKLPQEEMPTKVLIISDMEFNRCTDLGRTSQTTAYDRITQEYKNAGYEIPGIIFWNVKGREGNSPVQANTPNTALVSGASPAIVGQVLGSEDMTPYGIMVKAVAENERYNAVALPEL